MSFNHELDMFSISHSYAMDVHAHSHCENNLDGNKLFYTTPIDTFFHDKNGPIRHGIIPQLTSFSQFPSPSFDCGLFSEESTVSYEDSQTYSIGSPGSPKMQDNAIDPALVSQPQYLQQQQFDVEPAFEIKYVPFAMTYDDSGCMQYDDEYEHEHEHENEYEYEHEHEIHIKNEFNEEYHQQFTQHTPQESKKPSTARKSSSSGSSTASKLSSSSSSKKTQRARRNSTSSTTSSQPEQPPARVTKRSRTQSFSCATCPTQTFKNRSDLRKHTEKHTKPYPCIFCGCAFAARNEWKRHQESQHLQLKRWRCSAPNCRDKPEFNRKDLFGKHVERMHKTMEIADMQEKCEIVKKAPTEVGCGYCQKPFRGENAWNELVDHVGQHYQTGDPCAKGEWKSCEALRRWREINTTE